MEQQQETWKLPEAFVARMKAMLGDACDIFLASYKKERALGLRVNTMKVPAAEFAGANEVCIKLIMGHSMKNNVTKGVYTHKTTQQLIDEVNKI